MRSVITILISTIFAAMMTLPAYADDLVASSHQFGSKYDASAKGYWSDEHNLTWTWFGRTDGYQSHDGFSVVIGNGPKYSDLYPEVTDREFLLKEYVNYPGEGLTNLNSRGEPKANVDDEVLQLLRDFVNSFDWIHSDELTRAKAVYERIAAGRHGNRYGSTGSSAEAWTVLRKQEGVCADYAREFKWLANYVGLECVVYEPEVLHAANLVRINGQWITVDAQMGTHFFDNTATLPVDFDVEYNRKGKEYQESQAYNRVLEQSKWEEQYWNGEISYEVLQEKVAELYQ